MASAQTSKKPRQSPPPFAPAFARMDLRAHSSAPNGNGDNHLLAKVDTQPNTAQSTSSASSIVSAMNALNDTMTDAEITKYSAVRVDEPRVHRDANFYARMENNPRFTMERNFEDNPEKRKVLAKRHAFWNGEVGGSAGAWSRPTLDSEA